MNTFWKELFTRLAVYSLCIMFISNELVVSAEFGFSLHQFLVFAFLLLFLIEQKFGVYAIVKCALSTILERIVMF